MTRIRMGMVGGGEGAFIGAIHRMGAAIDGDIELVCGAFSSDAHRSARSGAALRLPPHRVYTDYASMMTAESHLPESERMQFVAVVTPNHIHFEVAMAAIESGFHVLSDKPATFNLKEALQLRDALSGAGLLYGLAHTYTGYPLVKEARARIDAGELGAIRKLIVEYHQGWLSQPVELQGNKQAEWRLDPSRAGVSSCMADIGVHAANLAEYVTGTKISELSADLGSVVAGRELDDDGVVLLRMENGARGTLSASQICTGEENALSIRVYGELGGLEWHQQEPNTLRLMKADCADSLLRTGGGYLGAPATYSTRTPMGHPEGYIEAFANIYTAFAQQIRHYEAGAPIDGDAADCPGIEEAVRGMTFIELVVAAGGSEKKWHAFPKH